jgi:lipopolysaccharide/colanic/teichoic acid biosynthesis glycosyltransferase
LVFLPSLKKGRKLSPPAAGKKLRNGRRWQLVNLKPEYDEYYIKTRSFFLDLPDHPAMEERDEDGNLLSDGARLTRLGRFLRKTSMDPQITQIDAD